MQHAPGSENFPTEIVLQRMHAVLIENYLCWMARGSPLDQPLLCQHGGSEDVKNNC